MTHCPVARLEIEGTRAGTRVEKPTKSLSAVSPPCPAGEPPGEWGALPYPLPVWRVFMGGPSLLTACDGVVLAATSGSGGHTRGSRCLGTDNFC